MHVLADVVFDRVTGHRSVVAGRRFVNRSICRAGCIQASELSFFVGVHGPATLNLITIDRSLQQTFGCIHFRNHSLRFVADTVGRESETEVT